MDNNSLETKKEVRSRNAKKPKEKRTREHIDPIIEPALPLLLSLVCFAISLITLVIDRFIFPIEKELLAPVLISVVALILPAYLAMMISSPEKRASAKLSEIGLKRIKAEYVFFMIFAALFMMTASLILTLSLGGAEDASRGITLFGTFTAGKNEFTVSYPYLILVYAVFPAIAEEVFFRGVIFSRLSRVSFSFAAALSTLLYALFGFTLGGVIPSVLVGLMTVFVLYTTGSLASCMIVHFLFNVYRLLLESNIAAYFGSGSNRLLLMITVALALLISAILFFTECLRIFRKRAREIKEKRAKSEAKSESLGSVMSSIRSTLAYTPSLVFISATAAIFVAITVINMITL